MKRTTELLILLLLVTLTACKSGEEKKESSTSPIGPKIIDICQYEKVYERLLEQTNQDDCANFERHKGYSLTTSIDLSDLGITSYYEIPVEVFEPYSATEIDLSGNNLDEISSDFFSRFKSLEKLSLKGNNIDNVVFWDLEELHNLKTIDLSYNEVSFLFAPESIPKNITTINLSNNRISDITLNFFRSIKNLQNLNLSNNQFKDFNIGIHEGLKRLDLRGNEIWSLIFLESSNHEVILIDDVALVKNHLGRIHADKIYINVTDYFYHFKNVTDSDYVERIEKVIVMTDYKDEFEDRCKVFKDRTTYVMLRSSEDKTEYLCP